MTTDAEAQLRAGNIATCLSTLQSEIRVNPADSKLRVFLAQIYMLTGEWERAATQLSLIAEMDAGAIPMAHTYRAAIQCEQLRKSVFSGERSPLIFGDPEPWIALLVQSLALLKANRVEDAARLREEAYESAPTMLGAINGTAFEWIADADSRLGPILEVMLNGAYYWAPFHRIAGIVMTPPEDLRDLVWLPAQFTWTNGGESLGFIPVRYVGSETAEDDALRLARKTEWLSLGSNAFAGQGQRVLATSAVETPLLEVREIALRPAHA
jgi:type VI secretion system protein ImpE